MNCRVYFWSRNAPCHEKQNYGKGKIFCPLENKIINGNREAKCKEGNEKKGLTDISLTKVFDSKKR